MAIVGGVLAYMAMFGEHIIDNPTDAEISVQIGAIDTKIPAKTTQKLYIPAGTHTVKTNGKEVGTFVRGTWDGGKMLNPTLATYIEYSWVYGTVSTPPAETTIQVDGRAYTGPYRIYTGSLYMMDKWDYAVDEASPDEVKIKGDGKIKTELMRVDEFLKNASADGE
jgi:hypothetical protein